MDYLKLLENLENDLDISNTKFEGIQELLLSANISIHDVDEWITTGGPGSYTGLRIAASALKGILFFSNKKIYFDYDDAVYHNYDMSNNIFIKFFLASKIKFLMKNADGIIAGNKYTETYAKKSGATNVLILPTLTHLELQY